MTSTLAAIAATTQSILRSEDLQVWDPASTAATTAGDESSGSPESRG